MNDNNNDTAFLAVDQGHAEGRLANENSEIYLKT
jgi:hypothetical protein